MYFFTFFVLVWFWYILLFVFGNECVRLTNICVSSYTTLKRQFAHLFRGCFSTDLYFWIGFIFSIIVGAVFPQGDSLWSRQHAAVGLGPWPDWTTGYWPTNIRKYLHNVKKLIWETYFPRQNVLLGSSYFYAHWLILVPDPRWTGVQSLARDQQIETYTYVIWRKCFLSSSYFRSYFSEPPNLLRSLLQDGSLQPKAG